MTGLALREARKKKGWTQQESARRLRVSQAYLSMLERERRPVPATLARRFSKHLGLGPLASLLREAHYWEKAEAEELAQQAGALGYPGFSHMKAKAAWNPAQLLLAALSQNQLDARVVEALPWIVAEYHEMPWDWVLREAKVRDLTNRLGFVLTLASQLAQQKRRLQAAEKLRALEAQLHRSLQAREDTLCYAQMTEAERRWLREHRPAEAERWNILSNLTAERLSYAG